MIVSQEPENKNFKNTRKLQSLKDRVVSQNAF